MRLIIFFLISQLISLLNASGSQAKKRMDASSDDLSDLIFEFESRVNSLEQSKRRRRGRALNQRDVTEAEALLIHLRAELIDCKDEGNLTRKVKDLEISFQKVVGTHDWDDFISSVSSLALQASEDFVLGDYDTATTLAEDVIEMVSQQQSIPVIYAQVIKEKMLLCRIILKSIEHGAFTEKVTDKLDPPVAQGDTCATIASSISLGLEKVELSLTSLHTAQDIYKSLSGHFKFLDSCQDEVEPGSMIELKLRRKVVNKLLNLPAKMMKGAITQLEEESRMDISDCDLAFDFLKDLVENKVYENFPKLLGEAKRLIDWVTVEKVIESERSVLAEIDVELLTAKRSLSRKECTEIERESLRENLLRISQQLSKSDLDKKQGRKRLILALELIKQTKPILTP